MVIAHSPTNSVNRQWGLAYHDEGDKFVFQNSTFAGPVPLVEIGLSEETLDVVRGSARKPGGGSWTALSDRRLKKRVKPLAGALDRLLQLRGVTFEWRKPEDHGNLRGLQMGLIAQEVEEVFPEWISTNRSGYKDLTVRGFEALTVEAFKEIKAENETLKTKTNELEDRIRILEVNASESAND
jgi:hypothetical protein